MAALRSRIGLQEVVVLAGVDVAGARGNDAGADRTAEAEGIADGNDPLADAGLVRVAPGQRLELGLGLDLQ